MSARLWNGVLKEAGEKGRRGVFQRALLPPPSPSPTSPMEAEARISIDMSRQQHICAHKLLYKHTHTAQSPSAVGDRRHNSSHIKARPAGWD